MVLSTEVTTRRAEVLLRPRAVPGGAAPRPLAWDVAHHLPGRARLRIPGRALDAAFAEHLAALVIRQEGVRAARANAACGSLVVEFDAERVSPEQIRAWLAGAARLPVAVRARARQTRAVPGRGELLLIAADLLGVVPPLLRGDAGGVLVALGTLACWVYRFSVRPSGRRCSESAPDFTAGWERPHALPPQGTKRCRATNRPPRSAAPPPSPARALRARRGESARPPSRRGVAPSVHACRGGDTSTVTFGPRPWHGSGVRT